VSMRAGGNWSRVAGRVHAMQQGAVVEDEAVQVESAGSEEGLGEGHAPANKEEEYDQALENVSLAFAEFLHVALQVGMVHQRGTAYTLHNIS